MSRDLDHSRAPRFLITGIYDARDVVLALPRLAALRADNKGAHLTMIAPVAARDLLLRLRLVDVVRVLDDQSLLSLLFSSWWQRLTGTFDRIIDGAALDKTLSVDWHQLDRDMSFMLPPQPYILFALPDGLPPLRAAAVLRKCEMRGYHTALIGLRNTPALDRLHAAAPNARDLVGRIDLSDIPALAAGATCVIGGRDGMTALAALTGVRSLIVTPGEDDAVAVLPVGNTVWLQSDDLSYLAVGDIIKAILP